MHLGAAVANRILFHKQTTGPFERGFDYWYPIQEKGNLFVEHSWSHPPATADGVDDIGSTVTSAGGSLPTSRTNNC